eukprot:gene9826-6899_t
MRRKPPLTHFFLRLNIYIYIEDKQPFPPPFPPPPNNNKKGYTSVRDAHHRSRTLPRSPPTSPALRFLYFLRGTAAARGRLWHSVVSPQRNGDFKWRCVAHLTPSRRQQHKTAGCYLRDLLLDLLSRIPRVPGHESAAQVKWATFLFWWCLDPILRCHFQYYQLKRRLDRLLEKQPLWANIALGILAGLTLYFSLLHFLFPTTLPGEYYNIQEDAEEVLALISDANNPAGIAASSSSSSPTATGGDGGSSGVGSMADLPAFRLMRVKGEIICKLHYIVDMAEIRRQQRAVAALVAESKKAGEATHAAAAARMAVLLVLNASYIYIYIYIYIYL